MPAPTIFEACVPRSDILAGAINEADFAADLAKVIRGEAPRLYQDAGVFFANTHPTRGLKNLLANVFSQLGGKNQAVSSIFRLDTNYGGGKTHALIALTHVAAGMQNVANAAEFIDPELIPTEKVTVAAFDGENADPANGRLMGDGVRAFTPWGELAYALGGKAGYESVARSDAAGVAPGAETLERLIGEKPVLILLDELSVYLRKAAAINPEAAGQLTAFMTALFKAVETSRRAALVFTLAIGKKDGAAIDAYAAENRIIASAYDELKSVAARKATLLDPTEEDETVSVLVRRLFEHIDLEKGREAVDAYMRLWNSQKDNLALDSQQQKIRDKFYAGYPLHPELMDTLTEKTSTISNFQRVRGMLRLLARMVERLWQQRPRNTHALHLHHIDPGYGPIRQELLTRLEQGAFAAALKADIAAAENDSPSLAEQIDSDAFTGLATYAQFVARAIFLHSLAFNEELKGATRQQLRYSILGPDMEPGYIDKAIKQFQEKSAYLDDKPNHPLRFLTEPNLSQLIRQKEKLIDPQDVRARLKDKIRETFNGQTFSLAFFPAVPEDIEDNNGQPRLLVLGYEAAPVSVDQANPIVPQLVEKLFVYKNSAGVKRLNVNNLVFLVADEKLVADMQEKMTYRLALEDMQGSDILELPEHQRQKLKELYKTSDQALAGAIQRAYRHVYYPSNKDQPRPGVQLGYAVIEVDTASNRPGIGQEQVKKILANKFRPRGASPDSAEYMAKRTPLKNGIITTARLFNEYRQNPALAILEDDSILKRGIEAGISQGDFIYRKGELIYAKNEPAAAIEIDEDAEIMLPDYARDHRIWPRPKAQPDRPEHEDNAPSGGVGDVTGGYKPAGATIIDLPIAEPAWQAVSVDGLLFREALAQIWEKAKLKKFPAIGRLEIKFFDQPLEALAFMSLANALPQCDKQLVLELGFETADGGTCEIEYKGSVACGQPIGQFLRQQLKATKNSESKCTFELEFKTGLGLGGLEAFLAKMAPVMTSTITASAWPPESQP